MSDQKRTPEVLPCDRTMAPDIFVYYSDIEGHQTLKQGDSVDFEIEKGPKGPHSVNVRVFN